MARWGGPGEAVPVRKRADARRNERTLLDAAGAVFVTYGVDAPVREIAARAGLGMGTIYRHFPTRADLIVAVYEYQVDACVEAGPSLLETSDTPYLALTRWVDMFVDFVVTKHGLAEALQSERETFIALHDCLLDRLVPVLARLLEATSGSGEIRPGIDAFPLMRAIANLCIGGEDDPRYDAHEMAAFLVAGLRGPALK
jgi:AcrR family transcriptional regulator